MTSSELPLDRRVDAPGPAPELPDPGADLPSPTEESPEEEKRRRRRAVVLFLLLGLLAGLILLTIWYLIFRQPIPLPLPVIPDTQLPAYSTSLYGVSRPLGVAVTADGSRIYVAESDGDKAVVMLDAGGKKIATMALPPETGVEHLPVYVAIDPLTAEVYVTDRPTGSIYIYDRDGRYQRMYTPTVPETGWQPLGIAFDAAGLLYVTDLSGPSPRVDVFDRAGTRVRTFAEADALSFPNGVALDSTGNAYVTDSNNGRLLVYDTTGKIVARVGRGSGSGKLGLPRGIVVDAGGRVFIVDTSGQGVAVYQAPSPDQSRLDFFGLIGTEGAGDGQFEFPNGVAVDGRGRVYVTDTVNDRVQVWSY
jgi:DNA-binding beta-propeller fold protein YncE